MIKHTLTNSTEVILTSFHGMKFSDGTAFCPSEDEIAKIKSDWVVLTVNRSFQKVGSINGMTINTSRQKVSDEGLNKLKDVSERYPNDLILVSFLVLSALKEQGELQNFPTVVAFNATKETQREVPQLKVVDINNWAR